MSVAGLGDFQRLVGQVGVLATNRDKDEVIR